MKEKKRRFSYFILGAVLMLLCALGIYTANAKADTVVCTIVYYSNGGTSVAPQSYALNSQVTYLPTPTRDSYTFKGWYYDEQLATQATTPFTITQQVVVLYAKWEEVTATSLTAFYAETSALVGSLLDKNKIIVKATLSNGTSKTVTDFVIIDSKVAVLGANTFTVTYGGCTTAFTVYGTQEVFYTVSFESNGGTVVTKIPGIRKGETISLPAEPTKNGYTFAGWYMDSYLTSQFTKESKVNSNLILYAKWTLDVVVVEEEVFELNQEAVALKINQQTALYIVTYNPYLDGDIQYWSSNSNVASVTCDDESRGIVTGKKNGKATIYVLTPDGTELKCTVKVGSQIAAKSIKTSVTSKTIKVKGTYTIKVTFSPTTVSSKKLTFTTSNKKIATVTSTGKVTGKKKGSCYITVKTTDGSKLSKKVKIIVK